MDGVIPNDCITYYTVYATAFTKHSPVTISSI